MPTYWFECPAGHLTERDLPINGDVRKVRCRCKKLAKRILAPTVVCIPARHKAINAVEIGTSDAMALDAFENDVCPQTGMTDQQMVKAGKATTKDMSRWV